MSILDKNLDIIHSDPRPGDIKHSLADISKAIKYFDYKPQFDINRGLEETVKWF